MTPISNQIKTSTFSKILFSIKEVFFGFSLLIFSFVLVGCTPSYVGAPERMFSVDQEVEFARSISDPEIYRQYAVATGPQKIELRNQIVFGRMYGIDQLYSEYEKRLTTERQAVGFWEAVAQLSLNSVGTLAGGNETKAVLHAIAAGLGGATESYESEILLEKAISVLQTSMRANRKAVRNKIIERLQADATIYRLEFALTDLEEYYRAGTITGALIGVSEDATLRYKEAELIEATLIEERISTASQVKAQTANTLDSEARAAVVDLRAKLKTTEQRLREIGAKFVSGRDLTEIERSITLVEGKRIQQNLCVITANGNFGTETRGAIRLAKTAVNFNPRGEAGKIDSDQQLDFFARSPNCIGHPSKYLNAYEKFRYHSSTLIKELQLQLLVCAEKINKSAPNRRNRETLAADEANKITGIFDGATRALIRSTKGGLDPTAQTKFKNEPVEQITQISNVELSKCILPS